MRRRILIRKKDITIDEQYFTIESLEDSNKIEFNHEYSSASYSVVKTISISSDNGNTWT